MTDYNAPAPGQYNVTTETTTSASVGPAEQPSIGLDREWVKSLPSYLKIAEMVLDLILFICASANIYFSNSGGGWVQFVAISALITTLLFFLFHLLRVIGRLPGPWGLIEFIYYIVYDVLLLIAAIVAAALTGTTNPNGNGAIIASALFGFVTFGVYMVDSFFMYRNWKAGKFAAGGSSTMHTTSTTSTSYETRTQY
ncbi:CKLF-like MARVEL transmembrane domain-containing protein 7 [Mizuhopecten yessoensis]|uniref:CKLF-like MARVEL transmembrane domain-containing protein 7 n=1 Tax=Mizuhopecten yessoensis TaxID=6573 RepID=A0A210PNE3_MIZYE|nr:CKLF-like MARVEL transmembrane domain-containing protein 7 [Mizuhopecten yessoensis]OWF37974.1 CKLF-like MARVEL transmembrane domain-containing protein 7 [Mizuhopecten yessoensis]